jgi:hypothetical protein
MPFYETKLHQTKIDIYVGNLIPGTSGEDVLIHMYNMINKVLGHMWDIENDTLGFIKSVSQETKCYKKE